MGLKVADTDTTATATAVELSAWRGGGAGERQHNRLMIAARLDTAD